MSRRHGGLVRWFGDAEPAEGSTRFLVVVVSASTLTVMAGTLLAPVLVPLQNELSLTTTTAGLVLTAHSVGLVVVSPATGRIASRIGVRNLLGGGLAVSGVTGAVGAIADSFGLLLASRIAFGVGVAAVFTGSTLALMNLANRAEVNRAMGWRTMAMSIGGIVWPFLSGLLGAVHWRLAFLTHLAAIPLALLAFRWIPADGPPIPPDSDVPLRRTTAWGGGGPLAELYAYQVVASVLLYAVLVLTPLRLAELRVRDPRLVALVPIAVSVVMSASGFLYPRVRRRMGDLNLVRGAFGVWTLALVVAGLSSNASVLLVACCLFGAGMGLAVPSITLLVKDRAADTSEESAVAWLGGVTFGGQLLSPLVLGPLAERMSVATALGVAAGLSLGTALLSAARRNRFSSR